ncbi:MAG: PAS domain S-box protein [Methylococcales bacterium]
MSEKILISPLLISTLNTAGQETALRPTYKTIAPLVLSILLVAVGISVSFWCFKQIEDAAEARKHTHFIIKLAGDLMAELRDAESGQRGYLLTGDETFLEPYFAEKDLILVHLQQLRQQSLVKAANKHLEIMEPLVVAKLAELQRLIALRRNHDVVAAQALVNIGQGRRLMDSIRAEMRSFIQIREAVLVKQEEVFQTKMRNLFAIIVVASLFTLLFAVWFAILIYREAQQRLKDVVHLETQQLLKLQEQTNEQLQQTNLNLQISEEKLDVTLRSIGDAVIATDAEARVTLLNPLAEQLTGWSQREAIGLPVNEVFHIINQETRQPATIPVMEALAHGTIQGLANHTILIARDGSECAIADSCAPICNREGKEVGAVLVFRNVTEEYAIQQTLRDSVALVKTIFNTVVDGIITLHATDGIIETVNPAIEHMFGYSNEELLRQNINLLIPELNQDPRDGSLEHFSSNDAARAVGLGREVNGRRKDGGFFPLEIALSEMWLGDRRYFTGILRDITACKQAEEALLKAGTLQNAIFNSANFSSIATDAKGVIQIFNVGAERMLGYAAEDVMNKVTPADISDQQEVIARAKALTEELSTPIMPGFEALVFKASRGIEDIYELTYVCKDGRRVPAVVSVTALRDAQGGIIGYLLIGTDNTARKLVDAEREQLYQALQDKLVELQGAKSVAEKANLAKSEFLSSMSHELRTPLNAILGFAQLLETGNPTPTAAQMVRIQQIIKAGWYLLELINEILDLALIESGKLSLSLEPVSLREVMQECAAMIEPQTQQHNIKLTFLPFDSTWLVYADHTRLKQVMINLLSNAIKYNCESGLVEVSCRASSLEYIRITVKDSGAGLSPEKLEQLFQPFNRLGQENGPEEGTGIGLVVTKQLVELMEGSIGVQSTIGIGSEFWIEMIRIVTPQLATDNPLATALMTPAQKSPALHTLLYVEDNPANLMLVEQIIAEHSTLHMLSARDGKLGIALARANLPDVILMDINLPGINGLQALKILQEDPVTQHIPVIALSANAMPRDVEKGLEAGFFRYLTKPIKVNELLSALDDVLRISAVKLNDSPHPDQ